MLTAERDQQSLLLQMMKHDSEVQSLESSSWIPPSNGASSNSPAASKQLETD